MKPLSYVHGKYIEGIEYTMLKEKISYFMYMDDIQIFAKKKKELETLIQTIRIYSQDIGMGFGLKMCHTHNKKGKIK